MPCPSARGSFLFPVYQAENPSFAQACAESPLPTSFQMTEYCLISQAFNIVFYGLYLFPVLTPVSPHSISPALIPSFVLVNGFWFLLFTQLYIFNGLICYFSDLLLMGNFLVISWTNSLFQCAYFSGVLFVIYIRALKFICYLFSVFH